jgi:hypothetical protein
VIFYVGKGRLKRAWTTKRNPHWVNVVNKHGYSVEIHKSGLSDDEATKLEIALILAIGRRDLGTGPLVNMTPGGDGLSNPSPEIRAKMSAASRGRKASPETRAKMSEAHRNISDETRARISAGGKGRIHSPETRAKIIAANKGKVKSPETLDRIKSALAARSPEAKAQTIAKRKASIAARSPEVVAATIQQIRESRIRNRTLKLNS